MSKINLASTRAPLLSVCHYLAIALFMPGFVPVVLAQPDSSYTWNDTISFTGSGALPVSQTTYNSPRVPDPTFSVSMTGTGQDVDSELFPGAYYVTSAFQTIANITLPNVVSPSVSPFSVTAPRSGSDPGLSLTAPLNGVYSSPTSPPFYGLFPPPSGTDYSDTIASAAQHLFQYGTNVLFVKFNGAADLILGSISTVTTTPDLSLPGDDYYSFTYTNTDLRLTANIGENDPLADLNGTAVITVAATAPVVPEPSTWLAGILLLGICGGGAWQKAREA
jgi:hypothetical protein